MTDDASTEPDAPSAPAQGRPGETDLRTFLIADIRGYTTYTREHGDQAGAELARQFAELVKQVVAESGGILLELRGDEALVVYVSARQALRSAVELQAHFRAAGLPRGVGIGLDAGEAIPVGGGYRGGALNLAARLCAMAGPGQSIASETVIHLAARVDGVAYVAQRTLRLKGFAEPVRAVDVVAADAVKRGFAQRMRGAPALSRPRRLAAVAGIGIILVAIVAGALVGPAFRGAADASSPSSPVAVVSPGEGSSPASTAAASATPDLLGSAGSPILAFLDPATGKVVATTPIAFRPTDDSRFTGGSCWMLEVEPLLAIHRIDPVSHQVSQSISIPLAGFDSWVADEGTLWMTDHDLPHVIGIDVRTGIKVHDYSLGKGAADTSGAEGIAVGAGSLWIARPDANEIDQLDPSSGQVQKRLTAEDVHRLEYAEGALWSVRDNRVVRIDPVTATRTEFAASENSPLDLAFGGGYPWVSDPVLGTVTKLQQPILGIKAPYPTAIGAGALALGDRVMWVANEDAGSISSIDVATGVVRQIALGHSIVSVAAGNGLVMVSIQRTIAEEIAALPGKVLRIADPYDEFSPPDPPVNGTFAGRQATFATCVGLLRYPDEPAPAGWRLEPEAATALPTVSADGLTYTFTLREGFRFSPPSGEPVTAETYRFSIERALSSRFGGSNGDAFANLQDVVGARAFHDGTVDHVEGLRASGDSLIVTLEKPAPDLPARLTLPYYCPVPLGTPVAEGGIDPDPPISSAGPYYLAAHIGGALAVLRKNPNYHGSRPQTYDAIAFHLNVGIQKALADTESGDADAAIGSFASRVWFMDSALAMQWGPGSDAARAGDQRWFAAPRFGLVFLALNSRRGIFRDRDMRRAVAAALDLVALRQLEVQVPTDSLLPPSVPGGAAPGAPIAGPDLVTALKLMAGRTGRATFATYKDCSDCDDYADAIGSQLKKIGITVRLLRVDDPIGEAGKPGTTVDLVIGGLGASYSDPANLLLGVGDVGDPPWIGSAAMAELLRIQTLDGQERIDAAGRLSARLTDTDATAIPIGYPYYPMYFSDRVGCAFVQPAIGAIDLVSLCPRP